MPEPMPGIAVKRPTGRGEGIRGRLFDRILLGLARVFLNPPLSLVVFRQRSRSLLPEYRELSFGQVSRLRQPLCLLPCCDHRPGAWTKVAGHRRHFVAQRIQGHLHPFAILLGQLQAGFGLLGLFFDFRIRLWLRFSSIARRFLSLDTRILGRLALGGFLRSGSSLSLSHFACRHSPGLYVGRLPRLFLMPARGSHGGKLLLGNFLLRFLGQSFFLGSFPRGRLSLDILPGS